MPQLLVATLQAIVACACACAAGPAAAEEVGGLVGIIVDGGIWTFSGQDPPSSRWQP
jgi:hypothetical protein